MLVIFWCLQRTRTTSSSGSFFGQSPLASRANSGNYTSEANSYAASLHSQSTASSSLSFYSNGPVKVVAIYFQSIFEGPLELVPQDIISMTNLFSPEYLALQMSVPFIPIQDITIGRRLGGGSEGVVYAGTYLETPVAIKQLSHVQEMEMNLHIGISLI